MVAIYTAYILKEASAPQEGKVITSTQGDVLTLEVSGNGSGVSLEVSGLVDIDSEVYTPLAGINLTNFDIANTISGNGIYQYGVDGVARIKVELKAISGGTITAFARLTKGV